MKSLLVIYQHPYPCRRYSGIPLRGAYWAFTDISFTASPNGSCVRIEVALSGPSPAWHAPPNARSAPREWPHQTIYRPNWLRKLHGSTGTLRAAKSRVRRVTANREGVKANKIVLKGYSPRTRGHSLWICCAAVKAQQPLPTHRMADVKSQ